MSRKKILIVDDDPDVRQAMQIRLKANAYDTCFAGDALTSFTAATTHAPDLILLDLGLPEGDGHSVLERLKDSPTLARIPVVVVSGRDARGNRDRAVAAGAKAYLQKPVSNAELMAVIRQLLGEKPLPGDAGVRENWKLKPG
jgi:two-component system, OmpR family, KDP operon response regulator KdpE